MVPILVGIGYGALIGHVTNLLLFRQLKIRREMGAEPLSGIGKVFLVRYLVDALGLILFYLVYRNAIGLVAAGLSITVAVKVSLYVVFVRKGGRFV